MFSIAYFLIHKGFDQSYSCLKAFLPEISVGLVAGVTVSLVFAFIDLPVLAALGLKISLAGGLMLLGYMATGQLKHFKELLWR